MSLSSEIINSRLNNIILIGEYTKSSNKHNFQCTNCTHEWSRYYSNGMNCPKCSLKKRVTSKEDVQAELLKRDIILLEYTSLRKNATFQCKNGHQWTTQANSVYSKKRNCPHCTGIIKLTEDSFNQKLISNNINVTCLEYNGSMTLSTFKCSNGHIYESLPGNVIKSKTGNCLQCSNKIKKLDKKILEVRLKEQGFTLLSNYKNQTTKIKVQCSENHVSTMLSYNIFNGTQCKQCSLNGTSKAEKEIQKLCKNSTLNNNTFIAPYELDILSDTFAIEFNGLIWHSKGVNFPNNIKTFDKNKHLTKTEMCESKNIQLFHVFENEWNGTQKEIWKSMFNNKNKISKRVYARKCEIKEITTSTSKEFLKNNHLQGNVGASIKLGLYYKNDLLSVMTFGKSRFNKNIEYELMRFATKLGYIVIGGASKLLKYFERNYNPDSLISYANRRWSTSIESQSSVYEKIGFEFSHNTTPNYFYFKPKEDILWSRNKFQKYRLKNLLTSYNEQETEVENMLNNGYRQIFDSGNKVYTKIYKV